MPTQTFYRLPDEKRERLIDAAWEEFTTNRFADASINRIVRAACIPRGSFYQYFEGKDELFFLLLGTVREDAFGMMSTALAESGGDPFRAALRLFDDVFRRDGTVRPSMVRVMRVLRLNQNMDVSQMVLGRLRSDPRLRELEAQINWTDFCRTDAAFLHSVAELFVFSFACAARNILVDNASYDVEREKLCSRLDILRRGSMKEEIV